MGREQTGLEAARAKLDEAGLPFPPIPEPLASQMRELGKWCWSTRDIALSPYALHNYVREADAGVVADYAIVAHDGRGVNSYALHYYLVWGPLRLFLQHGWGGVYMNKDEARARITKSFELAAELVDAVANLDSEAESDLRPALFYFRKRLTIVGSDFYGSRWEVNGETRSDDSDESSRQRPADVLRQALDRLRGSRDE